MCSRMAANCAQSCEITEAPRTESKRPSEGPHLSAAHAPDSSSLTQDEICFFHTIFMFLFPLKQFKYTVFWKTRIFFSQTCFSNLDTLQSTSNEAPILEIDPCIYEPFKSKFFPTMYWCTRVYKHKDSQSSSFFHLSNKGKGQWALTFISFGLLYLKRQSPLYSMHRRYPIREVIGFQYH